MKALKLIGLSFTQLLRQVWLLPETIANALKQRQQRAVLEEFETERLDRIRNPHKYRGK